MAAPEVHLVSTDDRFDVAVVCQCGTEINLGARPTLLDVLNAIGEHNTAKHLRPDNVGLRVRT